MKLSTLLVSAAAIGLLSTSFAIADDYLGGAVKSATVGGKEILTDSKGMNSRYLGQGRQRRLQLLRQVRHGLAAGPGRCVDQGRGRLHPR